MKILHLLYESEGDYFGIGGVGFRAYEIYDRLKERHSVTLLCKRYPGTRDGLRRGLRHIFVGCESRSLARTLLSYARHAAGFVRRHGEDYDIIVEEFSPAIPTFLGSYRTRPVVLQLQGYTGTEYFAKYNPAYAAALYLSERFRHRRYRNLIVVSEATRVRYGLGGPGRREAVVISNGIPSDLLSVRPGRSDYILYLGRIDIYSKGLDILLQAFGLLRKSHPGVRLVMAGDGRDRGRFESLIEGLSADVRGGIVMKGWVGPEEKKELLKDAILVAVPSRHETQGIVVLEAMACGKPLVVSDIPELHYAVGTGAAVSFEGGSASSLASVLAGMCCRADLAEMGLRGREWVRDLTWDRVAERFEKYLLSVLERSG